MSARPDGLPTIGLAIIARDEATRLPVLLDSVGWGLLEDWEPADEERDGAFRFEAAVDYVVVCDTGSTDGTKEVALSRGCKVIDFEWCDDFSAARQASYDALPECDFTLWADCDDVISGAEKLRAVGAGLPPEYVGTMHRYNYAQDESGNCICELWRERLVRYGVGKWRLPVHEVLDVGAVGGLIHVPEIEWIHHHPEDRERDPKRNYAILEADLKRSEAAGEPPDPRTLAYLGTEAMTIGEWEEATGHFHRYLEHAGAGWEEERCQVAHKLSISYRQMGEREKARAAAHLAIDERGDWPEGYIDLAEISLNEGRPDNALRYCDMALGLERPQTLLIVNPLEYTYQPLLMKSVALAQMGRHEESFEVTEKLLALTPQRDDLRRQYAGLAENLKGREAVSHFLALREILVRHDENAKAAKLMECAPYYIWNAPEIAQARLDQREMTLHAFEPDVYSSYYRENPGETPFEMMKVPIPEAHEAFRRVGFLREGLDEQAGAIEAAGSPVGRGRAAELRILDLSANDGWMLANLVEGGYGTAGVLHGMDLNADAVKRANERDQLAHVERHVVCADLHTAPDHFEPGSYDAVVCFETIEHVPDPRRTIEVMMEMVHGNGRIYLSTPDGAYERGAIPDWNRVESKGHLRSMRPHDLASLLCEIGKVEGFELQQRLIHASATPSPRRGKVIFYGGLQEPRPEEILDPGLGGSETALCKVAEHLARRGFDVRVYSGQGKGASFEGEGLRADYITVGGDRHETGQVLYAPAAEWDPGEEADLFVSLRIPEVVDRTVSAGRRALWLHDADYGDRLTRERADRFTDVLFLSQFHREHLLKRYPFLHRPDDTGPALRVTRNGIETSFYSGTPRRKAKVIYSSSPDRGLDVLLECWPAIRERCPDAELHHTYAPFYHRARQQHDYLRTFHSRLEGLHEGLEGVIRHGSMGQKELADLFLEASVWAYPSWCSPAKEAFAEISCISAMEAQAGGCTPVCLGYGALEETVRSGWRIPFLATGAERLSDEWREQFVGRVCEALEGAAPGLEEGRKWALEQDWSGVVDEWEEILLGTAAKAALPTAA